MKINYETIVDVIKRKVTSAAHEGGRLVKEVILSQGEWRELTKEISVTPNSVRTVLRVALPCHSQVASVYAGKPVHTTQPAIHEVLIKREEQTARDF